MGCQNNMDVGVSQFKHIWRVAWPAFHIFSLAQCVYLFCMWILVSHAGTYFLSFFFFFFFVCKYRNSSLKEHNLICLPNKIRLNLIHTFVMCRNKHISKKTPCFSRKRSKNKVKPNEFERRILKLSCYACSDNPKCRHAFSMFGNASSQNEFRFNLLRCMTETSSVALQ